MSKFKVGDIVKKIGHDVHGLKKGDVRRVTDITRLGKGIMVEGNQYKFLTEEFELVKEFTRQNLLTGDILIKRNGGRLVVLRNTPNGDILVGIDCDDWFPIINNYSHTFEDLFNPEKDVMKIMRPKSNRDYNQAILGKDYAHELLWERVEKSEAQIEKESIEAEMQKLKDRLTALDVQ